VATQPFHDAADNARMTQTSRTFLPMHSPEHQVVAMERADA
jgi:hypothetical protein